MGLGLALIGLVMVGLLVVLGVVKAQEFISIKNKEDK